MASVPLEMLRGLPHLDVANLCGRRIPFHALYQDGQWHLWLPHGDRLIDMQPTPVECRYYATAPVSPNDIYFQFLDFFEQRACWPNMYHFIEAVYADLLNAGASLSKLQLIFECAASQKLHPGRMVVTEIEYVFLTCRSIFDLLQEIVLRLWDRVEGRRKKVKLPSSYRDMVWKSDAPLTADQIAGKYGLPHEIAEAYARSSPFFLWLRSYRDGIAHAGHTPEHVFVAERGFAVMKTDPPFCDMGIWEDSNSLPNNLGSVLSVVAHVLTTTFSTCDAFASALPGSGIKFPPPIAPNHRIFICGPHVRHLADIDRAIREKPWYDTVPAV